MGMLKSGPAKAEMDITPLIDVTFQLIIFFMLVNNIIAEQTVEMIVPRVNNPQTRELGDVKHIVVNVAPYPYSKAARPDDEPLMYRGEAEHVMVGSKRVNLDQMDLVEEELKAAKADNPEVEVLLRADAALHYEEVQGVMAAIANAGIEQVDLVAYMPVEGVDAPAATAEE